MKLIMLIQSIFSIFFYACFQANAFLHPNFRYSTNSKSTALQVVDNEDLIPTSEARQFLKMKHVIISTTAAMLITSMTTMANADEKVVKQKKPPKVYETENGVKYIEVKKGDGAFPNDGDFVVISYTGFLSNGTAFDTTEGKGKKALSFRFGKKQVIPGIEEVLSSMQVGGERTCTIPSKLAYGTKGVCIKDQGCLVQPNENLNYVIKLKKVAAGYQ